MCSCDVLATHENFELDIYFVDVATIYNAVVNIAWYHYVARVQWIVQLSAQNKNCTCAHYNHKKPKCLAINTL